MLLFLNCILLARRTALNGLQTSNPRQSDGPSVLQRQVARERDSSHQLSALPLRNEVVLRRSPERALSGGVIRRNRVHCLFLHPALVLYLCDASLRQAGIACVVREPVDPCLIGAGSMPLAHRFARKVTAFRGSCARRAPDKRLLKIRCTVSPHGRAPRRG